jgi:hypothetical protein
VIALEEHVVDCSELLDPLHFLFELHVPLPRLSPELAQQFFPVDLRLRQRDAPVRIDPALELRIRSERRQVKSLESTGGEPDHRIEHISADRRAGDEKCVPRKPSQDRNLRTRPERSGEVSHNRQALGLRP